MSKKQEIKTMMEDDLKKLLEKRGLWNDFKNGKIKCSCGETITEENLLGFKEKRGKISFCHCMECLLNNEYDV